MDFLKTLTKIESVDTVAGKALASARNAEVKIDIIYKSRWGRSAKRTITPIQFYTNSSGEKYVLAFCQKAKKERVFHMARIEVTDETNLKVSPKAANHFSSDISYSASGRPICGRDGCGNLAEIKERTAKGIRYRKLCTSCRKSKSGRISSSANESNPNKKAKNILSNANSSNIFDSVKERATERVSVGMSGEISNSIEHTPDMDFMAEGMKQLQTKLLDLTRRNNLVNFRQSDTQRRIIRVIDETPTFLLNSLIETKMEFLPLPDVEEEPEDEKSEDFKIALETAIITDPEYQSVLKAADESEKPDDEINNALRELKDRVRENLGLPIIRRGSQINVKAHAASHGLAPDYDLPIWDEEEKHRDKYIQTLLLPTDLNKRLKSIYTNYKDVLNDKGLNVFYAAFGMLRWFDSENSDKENLSPLILLPIEIEKKKSSKGGYSVSANNAEPIINQTLCEKLKFEHDILLPQFSSDEHFDGNDKISLEKFFEEVSVTVTQKKRWEIKRFVSFGFFNYQDIAIFNDLQPENWTDENQLLAHDLIAKLLGGLPANETSTIDQIEDIDRLTLTRELPHLVLPADSSQHSAVINALDGKPLVIQGPPGTGKSQTIANLIAALTAKNKKILFLAEKQPALNVVKDRLSKVGLGSLIFDPKVTGNKSELYDVINSRLGLEFEYNKTEFDFDAAILRKIVENSRNYESYINKITKYSDKSFFELVWVIESASNALAGKNLPYYLDGAKESISKQELHDFNTFVEEFIALQNMLPHEDYGIFSFKDIGQSPVHLLVFKEDLRRCMQVGEQLQTNIVAASFSAEKASFKKIKSSCELIKKLRLSHDNNTLRRLNQTNNILQKFEEVAEAKSMLQQLIVEKSYLGNADVQLAEHYLQLATVIDKSIVKSPILAEKSVEQLKELDNETSIRNNAVRELISNLEKSLRNLKTATLFDLYNHRNQLDNLEYDKWSPHIANLKDDCFHQDSLQTVRELIEHVISVTSEIAALPKAVDFADVFESYAVDELEDLKFDYERINFLSSISSKSKKTKTKIKKLGVKASSKELTLKRMQSLIDCLIKAKSLENSVNKTVLFKDSFTHLFRRLSDLQNILSALQYLHCQTDIIPPEPFRNISPSIFFDVSKYVMDNRNLIDELIETFENKFEHNDLDSLSQKITETTAACSAIVKSAEGLGLPVFAKLSELCGGCSFESLYQKYLTLSENANLERLGFAGNEEVDKLISSCKLLNQLNLLSGKDWTASYLLSDNLENLDNLEQSLEEYERQVRNIGESYSNLELVAFDATSSEMTLLETVEKFNRIASAPDANLLKLLQSSSLQRKFEATLDPHFFNILREFFTLNEEISTEDGKNLFALRTARNILAKHTKEYNLPVNISEHLGGLKTSLLAADRRLEVHAKNQALSAVSKVNVPNGVNFGPKRDWSELSLIKNELSKQSRRISVRHLIKRSSNALLALMPVWFMNPVGASQYLPRKSNFFDVLIIDEASQMLPEKAIAALARAKNIIVVGDNKQMPPTNWLKAAVDFGDEVEEEVDAESILDLAQHRVGNSVSLNWHYRSRHEDLIKFSNHKFYEGRLEVFPTPNTSKSSLGVTGVKVDGLYKGNVNQVELEEVMLQARTLMERYPDETLGIVAINRPQMELIKQALENTNDKVIRDYINRWDDDPLNAVFVKNLDNVQGDERDNIIISTVYGRDEDGNLYQRFPSVVSKNGHRRLNVLVTRAKNRIILITSLNANDIQIDDRAQQGKKIFRDYIEYAMTGKIAVGEDLKRLADSDFEIAVGRVLEEAGFEVTPQVGVKGFRIDLGVSHHSYPHGYLAGIECDGAAFHSSSSARDRDAIRQDILESLGWKIYRVWSTDWFSSPDVEREKMLGWLRSVLQSSAGLKPKMASEGAGDEQNKEIISESTTQPEEEPIGNLITQNAGPSGIRGELDIEGETVNYWKPMDGLYELWVDNQLIGYTEMEEIEIAQANTSFADKLRASRVSYSTELLVPQRKRAEHDKFEIGLRWIYRQYKSQEL